jgi:hypothetical protein
VFLFDLEGIKMGVKEAIASRLSIRRYAESLLKVDDDFPITPISGSDLQLVFRDNRLQVG